MRAASLLGQQSNHHSAGCAAINRLKLTKEKVKKKSLVKLDELQVCLNRV